MISRQVHKLKERKRVVLDPEKSNQHLNQIFLTFYMSNGFKKGPAFNFKKLAKASVMQVNHNNFIIICRNYPSFYAFSHRFFVNGMCRQGENCPYGHDLSLSNKGTIACKYFATGTCANGDMCRFSHGDPKEVPSKASVVAPAQLNQAMNKLTLNPDAPSWKPNPSSWSSAPEFVPKQSTSKSTEVSETKGILRENISYLSFI